MPCGQLPLATQAVAGLPSWSHLSPLHATGGALAPAQYCPAVHTEQIGSDVAVAGAVSNVPAGQSVAVTQEDSLGPLVCVPRAQTAQLRSDAADGAATT